MKRLESDCCIFRNCDVRQARTAGERAVANGHHAARYCDVRQARTLGKRRIADFVYSVRDRDAGQADATVERACSDFSQAVWQANIYKRRAFGKRITSDFGYSIRKYDAGQATAIFERLLTNEHHAFRYRDAHKAFAVKKRQFANTLHAFRDCDAHKALTPPECLIADARHAFRDRDAGQAIAIKKRTDADARYLLPVMDRRDFDVGIGAGSDSGNRAGSISVGHECKTLRAFVQGVAGGKCGVFHGVNPFWFMFCVVSHHQVRSNQLRTTPFRGFGINSDWKANPVFLWKFWHPKPTRLLQNLSYRHRNTHCRNRCLLGRYTLRLPSG